MLTRVNLVFAEEEDSSQDEEEEKSEEERREVWRLVNSLTYVVASLRIYSFLMKMNSEEMTRETITSRSLLYVVYISVPETVRELT